LFPQTCTDAPWTAQRRFVCSPLALWATPLFADVATVEEVEELHLMLHEVMHWHEDGLLGGAKPMN
jgi:hypothetical protein